MAKQKELELETKTGRCEICGAETFVSVRHLHGYTAEQWDKHALAQVPVAERAMFPPTEEEIGARTAFYSAKSTADQANAAVVEAQHEPLPGGLRESHGFYEEIPRDGRAERKRNGRVEAAETALREALVAQTTAERAWRGFQRERFSRMAAWRAAEAQANRELVVEKEKKTFVRRIAALIGA